jgi:hypothetical protein
MLDENDTLRSSFLMLDPSKYSGPEGMLIRHLYGRVNKIFGSREGSDLHLTLCYVARHLLAMNASDQWIGHRTVIGIKLCSNIGYFTCYISFKRIDGNSATGVILCAVFGIFLAMCEVLIRFRPAVYGVPKRKSRVRFFLHRTPGR